MYLNCFILICIRHIHINGIKQFKRSLFTVDRHTLLVSELSKALALLDTGVTFYKPKWMTVYSDHSYICPNLWLIWRVSTLYSIHITSINHSVPTDYHHNIIIELSIRWCVWEVGEGFPGRVLSKTLKWTDNCVFQCDVLFPINR